MSDTDIFKEKGLFFYPFTKPLSGTINDLCSNPVNFGCNLNNNYNTTNCGTGSKPVLDCGVGTSAVCCPETIFPYAKTTNYCTYLNNQGCFGHQTYIWPHGQGTGISCPTETYNISECGLCCPPDITSNMNFTNDPYDSLKNNIIGTLWNKDDANLDNGLYKITIGGNCVMNFIDQTVPVIYKNLSANYPINQYPGDCGETWQLTKMTQQYIGNGIYPSSDLKYVPGGYTLYNNVSKTYMSLKNSQYGHGVTISLSLIPTVVSIFKNTDGSYRIQNAKNQIASFSGIGNIGNPINCVVLNQNNNFSTYNWGNGLSGLPCGINNTPDQNNYKFQFTKVDNVNQTNIPATLPNGEYYIEIDDYQSFVNNKSTNNCISFDGSISNYGGSAGTCGTLNPRFSVDGKYKWVLSNESGGGFSLQNEIDGNYLQSPIYGKSMVMNSKKAILNIFKNTDGTVRITNTDLYPICLINTVVGQTVTLQGYNWNVNTLECGTGENASVFNYKFNFVPVPDIIIPPVSDLPQGEGIYEINTGTSDGVLFDQASGGGTLQIQPNCTIQCPIIKTDIPNILEMSSKYGPDNLSEQRWTISKDSDDYGNVGYTIKNVATNRYLTLSSDFTQILTTSPTKTVLFIYNSNGSFTIQNRLGACLYRSQQQYANNYSSGLWNYNYMTNRLKQSGDACGMTSPSNEVLYIFNFITPPGTILPLTGYGGNCDYIWYNADLSITTISGFSDEVSCDTAINISKQNAVAYGKSVNDVSGSWESFFNGEPHILYTSGGKCISVDDNGNIIASTTCTKYDPTAQTCTTTKDSSGTTTINCNPTPRTNQPWYWIFTPEKINSKGTGNYFIKNQSTGLYLSVPQNASASSFTTTNVPTPVGIKLTYPTFGNTVSPNRLQPTSYYFHFINPSADITCAYTNNTILQSVSWGINTGLISGFPITPVEQQQRQVLYECGTDPTKFTTLSATYNNPNPNYQFTVDGYCASDFSGLCFHDDGSVG
jgi:hypothetical protein